MNSEINLENCSRYEDEKKEKYEVIFGNEYKKFIKKSFFIVPFSILLIFFGKYYSFDFVILLGFFIGFFWLRDYGIHLGKQKGFKEGFDEGYDYFDNK